MVDSVADSETWIADDKCSFGDFVKAAQYPCRHHTHFENMPL